MLKTECTHYHDQLVPTAAPPRRGVRGVWA